MRDTKTKSKSKKKKTFSKKQIHEAIQKWSKVLEMMNEKGQARWKNEVLFDFKKWERDDFPPDFFDFDGSEMDIGQLAKFLNYAGIDRYVTYNHPEKTERIIAKLIYEMHKKKNDKKFQDDAKELINAFLHAGALAHDLECRTYMDDIYYIISSVNCSQNDAWKYIIQPTCDWYSACLEDLKLSKASKNGSKKPHNISQERVTKDNRCGLEEEVVDKLFGGGNNPEKNDIGAEKPRRVKFTAREVNELFNMLRVDPFVGGACGAYGQYPTPCHAKDFRWFDSSKVKDMKFNCYMCVDAGHLYDDLGGAQSKERLDAAIAKVGKVVERVRLLLAQAESPMLRSLEVDIVNDGFQVCRTHESRGDDCDDYFGVELFLKFHFPSKK